MRYGVLMYADPAHTQAMTPEEIQAVMARHEALGAEMQRNGELKGGAGLRLPHETLTLRVDGEATRGPLDTNHTEQLTAYYEIECADEDRAREIAERVLDDHVTAVEIRRIHDTAEP
jgi:hypothetical protein